MWQETTRQPRNRRIWDEELEDFVPRRVLDFHVHVCNRATLPDGQCLHPGGQTAEKYDLEDLARDLADVYPMRDTKAVCFGMPNTDYDKAANDRYLGEACDRERFFPFRLLDPAEDPETVRADIEKHCFLGFKPYLNYVRKEDPNQVEVREMLPEPLMQIADDLGLIIMLHIPRKARLADPLNQQQVKDLCRAFPRAQIVLAHIGRAYFLKNIVGNLEPLADLDNLYLDVSMLNHWEVLEHAFRVFPAGRILYATDTPIALAPGKSVEINDQYTYVTPVLWHLSISDDHNKLVFTSFLYEELRAIRRAVERLGLDDTFVTNLFHDNGMGLLQRTLSGLEEQNA